MRGEIITSRDNGSRRGFSLLEILVAVAIIALLLAILLPVMNGARRQARHAVCQTNLRQIGGAWHMYLQDSKGRFLKSVRARDNYETNYGGKQGLWPEYQGRKPLNRYLRLPLVTKAGAATYRCPVDAGSAVLRPTGFDLLGTSYRTNQLLVGDPKTVIDLVVESEPPEPPPASPDPCRNLMIAMAPRITRISQSSTDDPARLLLAGDIGWYYTWFRDFPPASHADWHGRRGRHNLVFLDGHVAFTQIRKGLHTTPTYTLIPFGDIRKAAIDCQREVIGE